jgi:cysteine desulfurase
MIYLDYNATTPVLPEVLEAMMLYLTSEWGNPSSTYKFGSKLKTVIETARAQVAELIGAHAMEIIFTSCATDKRCEHCAIFSAAESYQPRAVVL